MGGLDQGRAPAGPPAVIVVGAAAAATLATRLGAGLPGAVLDPRPADQLDAVMADLYRHGQACVYIGPVEPLVLALAPLIAGRDAVTPVVVVTPDGAAVIPLVGGGIGADTLAATVARLLGLHPPPGADAPPRPALAPTGAPPPNAAGRLAVVGLGPGAADLLAPAARAALDDAEDIVGYTTYVRLAGPFRPDQRVLDSDNREELARARLALGLAAAGRRVALVCSGDPGVFAMAAAVLEALEQSADPAWHAVDLVVLPGVSAAHAAAARVGAPLGHDFCVLSLSDNLKPWAQIERRLAHAAAADLVIALYNPRSLARPTQFDAALALLRETRAPATPVVLGRDIGRPGEQVVVTTLGEVRAEQVDMRTVVIIGSSQTRRFPRAAAGGVWVYTPRWYPAGEHEPSAG